MHVLKKAARISQVLMGLVFLVAGLVKIWEPLLFYWDSMPYFRLLGMAREHWPLAARALLALGPVEWGLGLALLLNWRPRLVLSLALLLIGFFFGLTGYAWHMGVGMDCGCFGNLVERTPGEAAVEDAVMLVLLAFAWWGRREQTMPVWPQSRWLVAGGLVLALGVGAIRFVPEMKRLDGSDLQVGVRLTGLKLKGVDFDLMEGDYLVEVFSPNCPRCFRAVPKLNQWADDPDLPPVVALQYYPQDSPKLEDFKKRAQPRYEIVEVARADFSRLVWQHGYPRLAFVRDGVVQAVWEHYELPTGEELKNLLAWHKNG